MHHPTGESGDEEESDAIMNQVLDEIGIEVSGKLILYHRSENDLFSQYPQHRCFFASHKISAGLFSVVQFNVILGVILSFKTIDGTHLDAFGTCNLLPLFCYPNSNKPLIIAE